MTETVKIAVIGGSGLYDLPEITDMTEHVIDTPFGKPSNPIMIGTLEGKRIAFLARHGTGHVLSPALVPQRANIYALKSLGVRFIVSANACGSLRQEIAPAHIAIPDQLIDYNIGTRERSFFNEEGLIAHVSVADPFDAYLREQLVLSLEQTGATFHDGGTFLIEDGPRFATRAESHMFRAWGCDLIGMTAAPEAFLAREAEIAYASMAHVTDYDSWHEEEEPVTVDMVLATVSKNVTAIKKSLLALMKNIDLDMETPSHTALASAITTNPESISDEAKQRLHHVVKRVLNL
ncbi:MAG: S-methyl-5'-thioadenosine phosphorylase [Phototrophicaceae bacterium]